MHTFLEWLSGADVLARLRLIETYYSFDPAQYNQLFDEELGKVIERTSDPQHRKVLQQMLRFPWISYIAASVRHAGYRDYREVQEKTHDVAVKLLTGKLFRGFDERISGPIDLRFKKSVANAVRNLVELDHNRRRYLPTLSIRQEFEPGGVTADDVPSRSSAADDDEKVIDGFRQLLHNRLGDIAVAIFNLRLSGGETQSLVGSQAVGSPGKYVIKRIVRQIKQLAREYATSLGDSTLLRRIQKAMASEEATVQKRQASAAARQGARMSGGR